ncbi:hypothetical protein BK129_01380 [Paenibacillus amylolyticus]|uniref:hypothetical protein n=1 Tax=Paenibacillus amylolyticus TaxID=1451 RepID=UPI00096DCEDA|nr:hypothetical protein [Paenibacillus amylolyticus]OMF09536.1 hypothetical protein BK129_01380 [Paenibacillus amylolyticus]
MENIDSAYIETKSKELTDVLCDDRQEFYRKHTILFQRLRLRLPLEARAELSQIEELFNEGIINGVEMYSMGLKEGIMYKTKSPQ